MELSETYQVSMEKCLPCLLMVLRCTGLAVNCNTQDSYEFSSEKRLVFVANHPVELSVTRHDCPLGPLDSIGTPHAELKWGGGHKRLDRIPKGLKILT